MPTPIRPRRSLLLVPAGNARALEASDAVAADGLVYDLAETIAAADKPAARERLRDHLARSTFPGERIVRINGLDTVWGTEDFLAARAAEVDAILLPRVEAAGVVHQIATALAETDAPDGLKLWATIETPGGVLNAGAIAAEASDRLSAFVVGTGTLKLASGIRPGRDRAELVPWLSSIVLAATAHDLDAIDGTFGDIRDTEAFAAECGAARRLGLRGKLLIHPSQIEPANAAFAPEPEAVAWAQRVVDAFSVSPELEQGVATLDGRTMDRLHLMQADRVLKLIETIDARSSGGKE